jgi:hypothetical protein
MAKNTSLITYFYRSKKDISKLMSKNKYLLYYGERLLNGTPQPKEESQIKYRADVPGKPSDPAQHN